MKAMLTSKISPSMMCADLLGLEKQLGEMAREGIEYLHIDIMDGTFVPNYTLGVDFCKMLHEASPIPLDIHLMIADPEAKLKWFPIRDGDYVAVHYEAGYHIARSLQTIRDLGGKPMVALNPGTPADALSCLTDELDGVLVMAVNPGFAGQKYIPATTNKIRDVRRLLDDANRADAEIEVDGNVSFANARIMRAAGANIFVAGTSGIFQKDGRLSEHIREMRKACA
ncbi:MAG: ribulose-phosphate 3-epimerase [Eubacteriales bacterium]|nr:ribulose-phosphate 3-epimerase [Eubacteriales bacterium]